MTYTDEQLKRTLAKMLPEKLIYHATSGACLYWKDEGIEDGDGGMFLMPVGNTELLQLCLDVGGGLTLPNKSKYFNTLWSNILPDYVEWDTMKMSDMALLVHATWQQRTTALAQTLGVEIV